ncbi:hypothetical protein EVAR_89456_1, partial [Eumeta japonica]
MPGTIQERYPIPIKAYTVSIQEEMPGTSEERQPTLSESYTTDQHVLSKTTESETVQITDVHSEVPVLTIPEEFDIVETDFTEIDKQPGLRLDDSSLERSTCVPGDGRSEKWQAKAAIVILQIDKE